MSAAGAPAAPVVVCGFCGREFAEDRGQPACRACPLSAATGGCRRLRCPHCGYENPVLPRWLVRLAGRWWGRSR